MPKVWNLGNTTVRNANRIEDGLRVFAEEFQGKVHGQPSEARFAKRLREAGVIQTTVKDNRRLAWFGRKWRSVLVKLGFSTEQGYRLSDKERISPAELAERRPELKLSGLKYEVTPAGWNLLEAKTLGETQDIFLRQLIRHEITSPIEYRGYRECHMKPFVFLLAVLMEMHDRGAGGLNKIEIGAFVQIFVDHNPEAVSEAVSGIMRYRERRDRASDARSKKQIDMDVLSNAATGRGIAPRTLVEYADTTFRYTKRTGVVTQEGPRSRLCLRETKLELVRRVLVDEPKFDAEENPLGYLVEFYSGTGLPTDDIAFSLSEIEALAVQLKEYGVRPVVALDKLNDRCPLRKIEQARYRIQDQLGQVREEKYAEAQAEPGAIQDIIETLDALQSRTKTKKRGILDGPAYLEWAVWRGFLAIDRISIPIHATRRFKVDEDFLPLHTAPGGGPDLQLEFDDFVLVVEVTLTQSSRQVAVEGEPVRRHVADAKEESSKDVYAMFVAPTIDNNTAETFRVGSWYRGDKEECLDILPLSLDQFREMIEALLRRRYDPSEVRALLEKCCRADRSTLSAPQWKQRIDEELATWLR